MRLSFSLLLALVTAAPALAQPANDPLAGAAAIASLPFSASGSNVGATAEPDEAPPGCGSEGGSLWWAFTPATTGTYHFSTAGSGFDTVLSLWRGSGHPLSEVACNDDNGGPTSALTAPLDAGTTYYVRLDGYNGDEGAYALGVQEVAPPTNDALAAATVVPEAGLPYSFLGTNDGASLEPGEAVPTCGTDGGSLWWRFTPATNSRYRFLVNSSEFFSVLSLWTGSGHPLAQVDCNVGGFPTRIVANLTAGTTYYLRLHSDSGETGLFDLSIDRFDAPPGDARAAPVVVQGALPQTLAANTSPATSEPGEATASCSPGVDTRSVWFRYTPTADGTLDIDAQNDDSFSGTSVAVYSASTELQAGCSGFGVLAFQEDARAAVAAPKTPARGRAVLQQARGVQTMVSVPVTAGTVYDIRVATQNGGSVNTTFSGPVALPVELVAFDARADGRTARLTWTTASETNNAGFVVEQQHGAAWADASGLIAGHGTTSERHVYGFDVAGLTAGTHAFRLRQTDTDGAVHHSAPVQVEVGVEGEVRVTLLGQRAVRVETASAQAVTVEVYDAAGRTVQRVDVPAASGTREVGLPAGLAAGAYVVRVRGERFAERRTLVVR